MSRFSRFLSILAVSVGLTFVATACDGDGGGNGAADATTPDDGTGDDATSTTGDATTTADDATTATAGDATGTSDDTPTGGDTGTTTDATGDVSGDLADMGGDPFAGLPAGRLEGMLTASREVARIPASDAPQSDSESVLGVATDATLTDWRWVVTEAESGDVVFTSDQANPTFTCPDARAAYDVRVDYTDGSVVTSRFERRLVTCALPRTPAGRPVVDLDLGTENYLQQGRIGGEVVPPGALVRVSGTVTEKNFALFNFQGTAEAPIHFVNVGQVESIDGSWGLHLINCQHVIVDGFGDDSVPYGFVVDNATNDGGQSVWVRFYTQGDNTVAAPTGIELYGIHVRESPGTGIQVSTTGSEMFNRDNWTHDDLRIHHTRVENAGDEGFYIGYFTDGVDPPPHKMVRSRIYRNHIENTGWDGLQVSNTNDLEVHDNVVLDSGLEGTANQRSTLQVNSGNRDAHFFGNRFQRTTGGGVDIQVGCTGGDMTFFGNVFESPNGPYVHGGASDGPHLRFINNTFVLAESGMVRVNRNSAPDSCRGSGIQLQRVDAAYNLAWVPENTDALDVVAGDDDTTGWVVESNLLSTDGDGLCLSGSSDQPPFAPTCDTSEAWSNLGSALDTLGLSAGDLPGGTLTDVEGYVLDGAHGTGAYARTP